jgi:hypothetical protein
MASNHGTTVVLRQPNRQNMGFTMKNGLTQRNMELTWLGLTIKMSIKWCLNHQEMGI